MLTTGLHACLCARDVVILDLGRNRYSAVTGESAKALMAAHTAPASADHDQLAPLVARGILERTDRGSINIGCEHVQRYGEPWGIEGSGRVAGGLTALRRMTYSVAELRLRSLDVVLRSLSKRKSRTAAGGAIEETADSVARAFDWSDRIVTPLDQCLPRSIAVMRSMLAAGCAADLVIGVKLHPFEAHCWVQAQGRLVGDTEATVAPYTPILAI